MCLLGTSGNSPLCPSGHWPFGAAALLSLHFCSLSLQAGHRVPLTMCNPWMTSFLFFFSVICFCSCSMFFFTQPHEIWLNTSNSKCHQIRSDYCRWTSIFGHLMQNQNERTKKHDKEMKERPGKREIPMSWSKLQTRSYASGLFHEMPCMNLRRSFLPSVHAFDN